MLNRISSYGSARHCHYCSDRARYLSAPSGYGYRSKGSLLMRGSSLRSWAQVGVVAVLAAAVAAVMTEGRAGNSLRATPVSVPAMIDYRLGPLDKVRVRVFEWRPSRDEIVAWSALNAEYTVGPSGTVALPLIGEIQAMGNTTAHLASDIAVRLRERMGLATAPDAVVDIVEYRPIYVTGQVEKPGEYAFRPGLTVLQAMSLAGGMMRPQSSSGMRLEREIVSTTGEIQLLESERQAIMARRARLRSELSKTSEISFPAELTGPRITPSARRVVEQERLVFHSRSTSQATKLAALHKLKEHLLQEVSSLAGQIEVHKRQIASTSDELEQITALAKKGLTTSPRKLALERNLAQLEGEGLRLETSLQRARQEVSKTEIAVLELENQRSDELTSELLQSEVRLDQVEERLATAGALLHEAQVIAPHRLASLANVTVPSVRMTVVRVQGDNSFEIEADETTQVLPGDTVKVQLDLRRTPAIESAGPETSRDSQPPLELRKRAANVSDESGIALPLLQ